VINRLNPSVVRGARRGGGFGLNSPIFASEKLATKKHDIVFPPNLANDPPIRPYPFEGYSFRATRAFSDHIRLLLRIINSRISNIGSIIRSAQLVHSVTFIPNTSTY
jgi:hypothetical protein